MTLPLLYLKRREDRRIRAGHPWVFSNEVDVARSPLTAFKAGSQVSVVSHADHPLGSAYVNPATLICARVFSRRGNRVLDATLIRARLQRALALRERMGEQVREIAQELGIDVAKQSATTAAGSKAPIPGYMSKKSVIMVLQKAWADSKPNAPTCACPY